MNRNQVLADLRTRIAAAERHCARPAISRAVLPFGLTPLDRHLPDGGLALGALHEFAGGDSDADHAATATLFLAGILARLSGPVLWVLKARDLFAPGLAGVGLHPDRVIYAETGGQDADILRAMEEGLRHGGPRKGGSGGLAAVVGELTRLPLTASRRLHLAAEAAGTPALVLRRWRPASAATEPNAATTRWTISAAPGSAAGNDWTMPRARWRLALERCRAGEPMEWIVEGCDAQGRLAVPADLADRPAATPPVRWEDSGGRDRRLAAG
jgi:protein ImuA